jgi:hypothetical protein
MPIDSKAQQAQLTIPTGKVDLQYGYSAVRKMSFKWVILRVLLDVNQ